ncbi:hypothetical protein ACWEPN_16425, partial [Nonomuraea wenchangensis]
APVTLAAWGEASHDTSAATSPGSTSLPVVIPAPANPAARGADNRHARRDLGWTPAYPSWREGFAALAGDRDIPDTHHSGTFSNGRVEHSRGGHDEPMPVRGKAR